MVNCSKDITIATAGTIMAKLNAIIEKQNDGSMKSVTKTFSKIKNGSYYSFGLTTNQRFGILGIEVSGNMLNSSNSTLTSISGITSVGTDGTYIVSVQYGSTSVVSYYVKYIVDSDSITSYINFTGDVTIYYREY